VFSSNPEVRRDIDLDAILRMDWSATSSTARAALRSALLPRCALLARPSPRLLSRSLSVAEKRKACHVPNDDDDVIAVDVHQEKTRIKRPIIRKDSGIEH
jgi:hypothetical protein